MKGKFITFEGCEGVGKSCQIRLLEQYLRDNGKEYFLTREPGGTKVSEQIRAFILDGKNVSMTDECEAMLYAAARVQLLKEEIGPRLDRGELVLCDRYIDSSFAYQGYARGLSLEFIEKIVQDPTTSVWGRVEAGRGGRDVTEEEASKFTWEFDEATEDNFVKYYKMEISDAIVPQYCKILELTSSKFKYNNEGLRATYDLIRAY